MFLVHCPDHYTEAQGRAAVCRWDPACQYEDKAAAVWRPDAIDEFETFECAVRDATSALLDFCRALQVPDRYRAFEIRIVPLNGRDPEPFCRYGHVEWTLPSCRSSDETCRPGAGS